MQVTSTHGKNYVHFLKLQADRAHASKIAQPLEITVMSGVVGLIKAGCERAHGAIRRLSAIEGERKRDIDKRDI